MKKNLKILAVLCAILMLTVMMVGCASKGGSSDGSEPDAGIPTGSVSDGDSPDGGEAENSETEDETPNDTLNAYTATYDEVVEYFKADGIITNTDNAININATAGYFTDYTGEVSTEVIAVADKANDYSGVYLVWFDIAGEHVLDWIAMKQNNGVLLYGGGMATLQLDSHKGMFGLGFGTDVADDVKTNAKAVFDKLDTTTPEDAKYLTSTDELAVLLKDKGYLQVADLVAEDLNSKYFVEGPGEDWDDEAQDYVQVDNYKYYAEFGSEAKKYGNITVFYFNLLDEYTFGEDGINSSGAGLAYQSMQSNNAVTGYVADFDWNYTPYTENGEELSFAVDAVFGRYAVAIDDSVSNKAEIVDFLKSLEK